MSFTPSTRPAADQSVAMTKLYRLHLMELETADAITRKTPRASKAKREALARAQKLLDLYFALGNIDFPASL